MFEIGTIHHNNQSISCIQRLAMNCPALLLTVQPFSMSFTRVFSTPVIMWLLTVNTQQHLQAAHIHGSQSLMLVNQMGDRHVSCLQADFFAY